MKTASLDFGVGAGKGAALHLFELMQILPIGLWPAYSAALTNGLEDRFAALQEAELSTPDFSFYTSVASVFSSKIEGETIELDSYIKHKRLGIPLLHDYTRKIDDLYEAYTYAQAHPFTAENLLAAHQILSRNLLAPQRQGSLRTELMYVTTPDGRIEYVAADPAEVPHAMERLFSDLAALTTATLTVPEAFYYAAALHLVFVKIHPMADGNGRTGRLLEKWFLAQKLGPKAWFLASEQYYYQHHSLYYTNLRKLGLEYDTLDYGQALAFLLMLPETLPL